KASEEFSRIGATKSFGKDARLLSTPEQVTEAFPEIGNRLSQTPLAVVLRIANHLENARSSNVLSQDEQEAFARQSLSVWAPLSSRLGMDFARRKLEDIGFAILDRDNFDRFQEAYPIGQLPATATEIIEQISAAFASHELNVEVSLGERSYYSIFRSWLESGSRERLPPHESAYPYLLTTESKMDCYLTLGIVHSLLHPLPGQLSDHIGARKLNGYQSLHTKVRIAAGTDVDVIIRDKLMHLIAERGVLASWESAETLTHSHLQERTQEPNTGQMLVFTPAGETLSLPEGATPIDFAFRIHKEIGYQCVGAFVNGASHDLDKAIKPLSSVRIITSKNSIGPATSWLLTAKTKLAISEVQKYYQVKDFNELIDKGRERLNGEIESKKANITYQNLYERLMLVCKQKELTLVELLSGIAGDNIEVDGIVALICLDDLAKLTTKGFRETLTEITITARDRSGLALDVTKIAAGLDINLETIVGHKLDNNISRVKISVIEVPWKAIESLIEQIRSIRGVQDVHHSGRQSIAVFESGPYTLLPAKGHLFKGRQAEIIKLINLFQKVNASVLVWGPRRIGKTSLLGELPEHIDRDLFVPISLNLQAKEIRSTLDLVHLILQGITNRFPDSNTPKWSTIKKNPLYTLDGFIKRTIPRQLTLLISIDEIQLFDKLEESRESGFLSKTDLALFFRNQLQQATQIRALFCGGGLLRDLTSREESLSSLFEMTNFFELDFLARVDAERIITETPITYGPRVVDRILELTSNVEKSHNHPGYIQIICRELALKHQTQISINDLEVWLNGEFPRLPEYHFSNLWGFSYGMSSANQAINKAVLLSICQLSEDNAPVALNRIISSDIANYISPTEISAGLERLVGIRTLSEPVESKSSFQVKLPLTALWMRSNFSLQELRIDHPEIFGKPGPKAEDR
ncbi:MAG: TGS domain-containing protein, partial [Anaerolineae bacterium]